MRLINNFNYSTESSPNGHSSIRRDSPCFALPCLVRCTHSTFCEASLRPSENSGPRSGPQFDIVPKCAEPYRCLGRHGAWDLTGDSGRMALARIVAKFGHDSPEKLSTAKAIPPLMRAKRWRELHLRTRSDVSSNRKVEVCISLPEISKIPTRISWNVGLDSTALK
jgi:hypothetical protein